MGQSASMALVVVGGGAGGGGSGTRRPSLLNGAGAPASANPSAMDMLPDTAFNKVVLSRPGATDNLQFMAPLSDEKREEFLEVWEETKAYFAE